MERWTCLRAGVGVAIALVMHVAAATDARAGGNSGFFGSGPGRAVVSPMTFDLSSVPTNVRTRVVWVTLRLRQSFPDNLPMLLQSPAGTSVIVMANAGGGLAVFDDEPARGVWKLWVDDDALNNVGVIDGATLTFEVEPPMTPVAVERPNYSPYITVDFVEDVKSVGVTEAALRWGRR